jgi:hypothetical protein
MSRIKEVIPMRFIRSLLLVLILLLFFTACSSASPKDDFAYTASSFTANVRGTYTSANGVPHPITARITVGELLDRADPAARPVTVVFSAPETLAGITVEAVYQTDTDGHIRRTVAFTYPSPYGEVTASSGSSGMDGLLRFAEALLPVGDVTAVSPTAEDGTHTVTRTAADGAREAVFLFSSEQALPLRVRVRDTQDELDLIITP